MPNAIAPQTISLPAGRIGFGASWQSSIDLPSSRSTMHSSSAWPLGSACATDGSMTTPRAPTATAMSSGRIRRMLWCS